MKKETRKFITYLFPGSFFPESVSDRVKSFDVPTKVPLDCYSFYFSTTEYVSDGKQEFTGETKRVGSTYYIGESIPVDEITEPDSDILKSNIRNNSPTKRGIKTHLGNWQMETENSIVLSPENVVFGKPRLYTNFKRKK
jgi:hypothetical protein